MTVPVTAPEAVRISPQEICQVVGASWATDLQLKPARISSLRAGGGGGFAGKK